MQPAALAKALRRRQLRAGLVDKPSINALNDMEILECYLLCAKCDGDIFADRAAAVNSAANVQEFLTLADMALAAHQCECEHRN